MKEKTGCHPIPSFYLVVIAGAFAGFMLGGLISKHIMAKIIGAAILGFVGAVLAIDDTCFDENGNAIMVPRVETPSNAIEQEADKKWFSSLADISRKVNCKLIALSNKQ